MYAYGAVASKLCKISPHLFPFFADVLALRMARPRHPCTQDMATQVQMFREKRDTLPDIDGEPVKYVQFSGLNAYK